MKITNLSKHLCVVASLCITYQTIISKMPYTAKLDWQTDKTIAAIEAQFSNNNFASVPTESSLQVLNYMKFDLESILFEVFEQGLPSDMEIDH